MAGVKSSSAALAPLTGLRVVEIGDTPGGALVARIAAEHGAQVTKLEPQGGAGSRRREPLDARTPEADSLHFRFYNWGKDSRVLELGAPGWEQAFDTLLGETDVLVSSLHPLVLDALDLDLSALSARNPALIIVSVTPFGLTGPWRNYKANDLVSMAAGGPLILSGYDDHSIPPICPGGLQTYHTGASFGVSGMMVALLERKASGEGQVVDVAIHDSLAVTVEMAFPYWEYAKIPVIRQTCRHAQPQFTQSPMFECGDGRLAYFVLITAEQKPWEALIAWMDDAGMAADLTDPAYSDPAHRQTNFAHIQGIVECFFLLKTSHEILGEGQARQLPVGIIYAPEDLLEDEHLRERDFFIDITEADGRAVAYPGWPYRYSAFPLAEPHRAPRLGESFARPETS
jgi:crotonobetainyl-CoA:carnitine CoA-transferase CaiB-like acyl-CoA transferase